MFNKVLNLYKFTQQTFL